MAVDELPRLNLDIIGRRHGPFTKTFNWRESILYALAVGAGRNELQYVYERQLKAVPSYPAILSVDPGIVNGLVGKGVFGLDEAPSSLLAMGSEIIIHEPLEIRDSVLTTEAFVRGIYDRGPGKGAQISVQCETFDESGRKLFTSIAHEVALKHGGFGGERPPTSVIEIPEREPDSVVGQFIPEDQAVLYRLTGDLYPLHVDPVVAKGCGFEAPIVHGLCTFGYACRALVASFIPGEPERMSTMRADYSRPLLPGVNIEVHMWKVSGNEAVFVVVNTGSGAVVLKRGRFTWTG